ncbi:MAG: DUF885 domain-containing protein [Halioglobus sp.]|nr:DUF885 domain-containing protein [Halioglobus sp.]
MLIVKQLAVLLVAVLSVGAASADWIEKSNDNALLVLRGQGAFEPETASAVGLEAFDAEVVDLRDDYVARENASDQALLGEMRRRLLAERDPRVRQDLEILIQSLGDAIETRRIYRQYMLPYFNLHGLLFGSFDALLDPRNDSERYPAALQRLRKYTGSEPGYTAIVELARARSRERFAVDGLQGPYRGELDKDLSDAPRYLAGIRAAFERAELSGWEEELPVLEAQLADYLEWLRREMLPRARPDHRLPAPVYADNLKNFGVRAAPRELIEQAQYAYQSIRSEMQALARRIAAQRGWDDDGLVTVLRRLKQEQIPQNKLLEVYRQRLRQIEEIIRREDIVSLPQRDAAIRLATEAEAAASPASFMRPPQLIDNTGQYGEFVLVQSNPSLPGDALMDDWSHDAITWALTVHETRPGHELQFASMVENGTSLARALFAFNSANAEGWGLYAEAVMHPYLPLEAQLFSLYTRLLRAARMFLDPMVNTGQLTTQATVQFLTGQLAMSLPMASSEAERYAFRLPGQATAYYYGYMNLMRLRTEVELALGDSFDQRAFHDFILAQGLLPPDLLREAVLQEFTR